MIPGWLASLCAQANSTVLVLGSACLLLIFALVSACATWLLLFGWPQAKGWRERRHYHLPMAEWDARKQTGMPLTHPERLAYELGDPEWWDDLEEVLWPHSEWVQEIQDRGQS